MTVLQAILTINTMSEAKLSNGFDNFTKKVENLFDDQPCIGEIAELMEYYIGIPLPSYVENDKALKNFIDNMINMAINTVQEGIINNDNISLARSGELFVKIKKYLKAFGERLFIEIRNAWVLE